MRRRGFVNFVDTLNQTARTHPNRVAVREGDRTWTYDNLRRDVMAGANVLANEGVSPGDSVAAVLPNTYDFVVAVLATLARRARLVPINVRFQRRELSHIATQIDAAIVLTCSENVDLVAEAFGVETKVYGTAPEMKVPNWSDEVAAASTDYMVPHTLSRREAFVLYTSGTTGRPKGAVHPHRTFMAVGDGSCISYQLVPESTFLNVMPMYHCTGMAILAATIRGGAELILAEEWDPKASLRLIDKVGITHFSGVPAMFKDWLAVADDSFNESSMNMGIIGGAGVSEQLIEQSEDLLGCPVLNGFGMTESFAAGIWEDPRNKRRTPSVGRTPDLMYEAKIVDPETHEELPAGSVGELIIRGDTTMTKYLDAPDATARTLIDGWLHTGDLAIVDEDGFIYLKERMSYTIITGGENVYPREIEETIETLPGVKQAAVVGRPDDRKGEKPVAFVERLDGASIDEQAVKDYCLNEMAPFKHPREIFFIEDMPRNTGGKIDRFALERRL